MTTAAVAVIIVSLTVVATTTGVLPTSKITQGSTDPDVTAQSAAAMPGASTPMALTTPGQTTQPVQAAPYPVQNVAPAPVRIRESSYAERVPLGSPSYAQTQPRQPVSPYTGHVTSATPITMQDRETGLGMIGDAVVGGLLSNQIGRDNGRTLAIVGGTLTGGHGDRVAKNYYRCDTEYRVSIRMDNGAAHSFMYKAAPGFQAGRRVHIENGTLVAG